jgi:FAD/FMN-containing dehydrogenase
MAHAAKRKVSQDVCVPPGALSHLLRDIEAVGQKHGLLVITFGHLGDGNLHVNVMADGSRKQMRQARVAAEDLFRAVLALDGTLSGEHGIGLVKARYISWELSAETMAAQRKVKAAFDPTRVLNPGKILGTSKSSVLS